VFKKKNNPPVFLFGFMNIASKYSFVGAFIGRPPSNDRKFMMKINCINEIQLPK